MRTRVMVIDDHPLLREAVKSVERLFAVRIEYF